MSFDPIHVMLIEKVFCWATPARPSAIYTINYLTTDARNISATPPCPPTITETKITPSDKLNIGHLNSTNLYTLHF